MDNKNVMKFARTIIKASSMVISAAIIARSIDGLRDKIKMK